MSEVSPEGRRGAAGGQAVLIVGGGIAGMAAAMHLAEVGREVLLLDAAPAIGGSMHLLDHTFPTDSCGICLMLPEQPAYCPTLECAMRAGVRLLPYAEVVGAEGEGTGYRVRVVHKARFVDGEKCDGCGLCAAACPEARPHDHEGWQRPEKAIHRPAGLRAVPDTWVIDPAYCTRCGACVTACPRGAVDLEMAAREEELEVGAVLLAPGFGAFDARLKGEYGYGVYDNVVTSLEFERMVSLAGSGVGRLARPSDGRAPQKVAFVQCVGSRDNLCGVGYCSSACCMYTAKQVALAKKVSPEVEATVFYMDLRAFGKDFEAYVAGVQGLPGVRYRRAMPSSVHEQRGNRDVRLSYVGDGGRLEEEDFDLLVLAVGFGPPAGAQEVARGFGVALNEWGFPQSDGYRPAWTGRPGVFVAGAFREPKDIPETVAEAAGAAAEVAAYLQAVERPGVPDLTGEERIGVPDLSGQSQPRGVESAGVSDLTGEESIGVPDLSGARLRDVTDEEPRVGVFVCECDGALAAVGVAEVAAWAAEQPGVVVSQVVGRACSAEGRAAMRAAMEAAGVNRVVIGGCTPRLYGDEFAELMAGAGLEARLLTRVNLREQVALPHAGNGNGLEAKARSLVGMAVAGLRAMRGAGEERRAEEPGRSQGVVVVGGGAAGMSAALALAEMGHEVELVERAGELGGQWREIRSQADGSDPQAALGAMVERVRGQERIRVRLGSEVVRLAGKAGRYRSVVRGAEGEEEVEHGAVVVATGGGPAATREYLYGEDPRVLSQRELEQQMAEGTLAQVRSVVMIQCVGSREEERPYCSRVCCTQAVKNALRLKALRPEVEVYVLYREVRTYGFRERYYEAARDAGVVFVRYEVPGKPAVEAGSGGLRVRVQEPVLGQPLELEADLVVLSVGAEPGQDGLEGVLGLERNRDGFYQEEQAKMKPLDLGRPGMYVAGLAHSPRFLEEAMAQGQGAAMRAAAYLAGEPGEAGTSVWVNERLCSYCGLCVAACPYGARVLDEEARVAQVDYELCKGCGVCAVVCPNKATLQKTFEHGQLLAALDMALV